MNNDNCEACNVGKSIIIRGGFRICRACSLCDFELVKAIIKTHKEKFLRKIN